MDDADFTKTRQTVKKPPQENVAKKEEQDIKDKPDSQTTDPQANNP